jgi:UDP-2,4-diacetamido-2,4,6-trideoxy-beta-L-altropyranose hydrolase
MNIVFRVDASARMGVGHIMRCLTLAEEMRARGSEVHFVCREHPGNLNDLLRQKGMLVTALPAQSLSESADDDYAAWLGETQAVDAGQTVAALKGVKPDWLVVDHYSIDVEWERLLSSHIGQLMVIDDLANRQHDCDVLLDQNYSVEREKCYAGLVPDTCKLLVGPRYALLRPEYAAHRKSQVSQNGGSQTVLVYFGGSDLQNMTGLTLNVLTYPELCSLDVDVVIGANNPHRLALEKQATRRPRTRIHGSRPHLADLMARADLSVGAGGATTWERMCLGLPSIVMSVADNQRSVSEGLAQAGLIEYIGDASEVRDIELAAAIKQLIENRNQRLAFAVKTQLLVDGLGTVRIADILVTN